VPRDIDLGSYRNADLSSSIRGFIDAAVEESLDAIGERLAETPKSSSPAAWAAKGQRGQGRHPRVLAVTGPQATEK